MERQHEFRLERKRPQSEHLPSTDVHHPPPSVLSSHSPYSNDPRLPGTNNPQFAKWILEQNVHYQTDRGSEIDLRSSRSSLTNISERDRPGSPVNGYSGSHYQREMVGERGGYYRSSSPPVRDSAPSSRPADYPYPSHYNGFGSATALDTPAMSTEPPTKFSEYMIPEMDEPVFRPRPVVGLPPGSGNIGGQQKNVFSSLSSQMTVESQQMLTPYSQQQTPSQQLQQQQHLDRLSMDVMLHTQLSGTSMQGGITALIPNFKQTKNAKLADGRSHLERADLKELEMDEIDLEKQRIRLMFYEQQKQEKANAKQIEVDNVRDEPVEIVDDVEKEEPSLSMEQLRQELESLDQIVTEQKKKYREIKMAREREEQRLKQAEKELFMECVNPNDQHQWHVEQKRRLREIEKLKSEQNERLQQIQYDEHRTKNKLKAMEAQATVIRQQLQKAEAAVEAQSIPLDLNSRSSSQGKLHSTGGGFKRGYDVFPTKMTCNDRHRAEEPTIDHSAAGNTIEWDIDGTKSVPAHAISFESMSTAITFDQPEIARELATTISESLLTEPTQDDPTPSKWPLSGYSSRPMSSGLLPSEDFFSTKSHSRNTLITDSDDIFLNQDDRQRRDHPQSMVTMDAMENSLPSLRSMEERNVAHGHQIARGYPQAGDEVQTAFRRINRPTPNGAQHNQVLHAHEQAWNGGSKQTGAEREVVRNEQAATHYDVPARARAAYQLHQPPSNRQQQHGRHHRGRGTSAARNQSSSGTAVTDVPSLDRPVQDAPRLVNGSSSGAPDVVPVSYSPASPHLHTSPAPTPQQHQVTGSELMMGGVSVPPPRSPTSYPIYDVPPPSNERERFLGVDYSQRPPAPCSPVSVVSSSHQQNTASFDALHHQAIINSHVTGHVTAPGVIPPSSPAADNIYDRPRSAVLQSPHSFSSTSGTNIPVYDVPASARRSAGYEGGVVIPKQDFPVPSHQPNHQSADHNAPARVGDRERTVSHTQPIMPKSKPVPSHRYGISKPGMGHSYSRGRPDLDKAKQYIDIRAYRNQGGARHPERIQRQQTDL